MEYLGLLKQLTAEQESWQNSLKSQIHTQLRLMKKKIIYMIYINQLATKNLMKI